MASEMKVNELISIKRGSNGGWQVLERKTPNSRPKAHHHTDIIQAFKTAMDLCAGGCESIEELLELFQVLNQEKTLQKVVTTIGNTGESLKQIGMNSAKKHADDVVPGWSDEAYECIKRSIYPTFTIEELRMEAYQRYNLPRPPDERAWGGIANRAIKDGLIEPIEYKKAIGPQAHKCPKMNYRNLYILQKTQGEAA